MGNPGFVLIPDFLCHDDLLSFSFSLAAVVWESLIGFFHDNGPDDFGGMFNPKFFKKLHTDGLNICPHKVIVLWRFNLNTGKNINFFDVG
jgi:hypothetical protein